MSTTSRTDRSASDVAARLRDADFVRIVTRADGDGLAAAGVLARSLSDAGVPFQVTAARTVAGRTERVERARSTAAEGDLVALVGDADAAPELRVDDPDRPASVAAWEVADEVATADPVLAMAGAVTAGATPTVDDDPAAPLRQAALDQDLVRRRPGVAVPTADPVDGLAHSTLVHGPFSGDPEAVRETLDGVVDPDADETTDEAHRRVASAVALSVAGAEGTSERGATAIERALRPDATGRPFATVGGYGDVLDAAAREAPGAGVALALGHDAREAALSAWREHARAAHRSLREATTARYDGVFAARLDDAPVETVARLVCEYRSPEPIALVVTDGEAAAVAPEDHDLGTAMASAAGTVGGEYDGSGDWAYARFDDDAAAMITAFREALA